MAKKTDIYENFLKTIEERERLLKKNKTRNIFVSLILAFLSVLVFIIFSIVSNTSLITSLFPGVGFKRQNSAISELQQKVIYNSNKISDLENSLSQNKTPSYVYLNSKLIAIENKNQYLYETILEDPNKAITPILLRKEQDNLNQKIDDLKKRVDTTNTWLLGIFATLIVSLILFIIQQIWGAYFSKKNMLKE